MSQTKIHRTILLYDIHTPLHHEPSIQATEDFVADFKPDRIVFGGDIGEFESISHWIQDKRRKVEGKRLLADFDACNAMMDRFESRLPKGKKVEKVFLIGNHEDWVDQYLDVNPQMAGLADLEKNLALAKRGYQVIPFNKFYKMGKLYCTHGFKTVMFHSKKMAESVGSNVVYGHLHSHQVCTLRNIDSPYKGTALPCLCELEKDFLEGKLTNWIHGFGVVLGRPDGNFNLYVVDIIDGKFAYGDKFYG